MRSAVVPSCIRCSVPSGVIRQRAEAQPGLRVDLVRRDEDRAHRQERVGALGAQPLAVALLARRERRRRALPVAGADVVDDDVAGDVVHRVRRRRRAAPPADDDAELDLEVEGARALGPDDRLAVGDDRVGELGEEQRPVRRGAAALGDVLRVVEPDAHDLARVREGRGRRAPAEPRSAGATLGGASALRLAPATSASPSSNGQQVVDAEVRRRSTEPAQPLQRATGQQPVVDLDAEAVVAEAVAG